MNESLGQPVPIHLLKKDAQAIKEIAASMGLIEQKMIRRMVGAIVKLIQGEFHFLVEQLEHLIQDNGAEKHSKAV